MQTIDINNKTKLSSVKQTKRDTSLDYLRGVAVFLMIIAHAIHFFHDGSNSNLRFWEGIGNTLCFTTFLFVSGAVTNLAYLNESVDWTRKRKDLIKRLIYLLFGYYAIAFASSLSYLDINNLPKHIFEILVFQNVPGFTEFIIPFIILTFITLFFRKQLALISKKIHVSLIVGLLFFILGSIVFAMESPHPLNLWKALFFGHEGVYRFPVFQYFIIFTLGLWWGNTIRTNEDEKVSSRDSFKLAFFATIIYLTSLVVSWWFNIPFIAPLNRWPPSIGFLAIGVAFIGYIRILIKGLEKINLIEPINRFFVYIGQDAFDMFLFSTFMLIIYQQIWGQKFVEWQIVLVLSFVLMMLSLLASSINSFNSPSLFRKGTDIFTPYQRLFKKRYIVLSVLMVVVVFGNLRIPVYSDVAGSMVTVQNLKSVKPLEDDFEPVWWDNEYGYYTQVSVSNKENFISIQQDNTIKISIDHKKLTEHGKSTVEGVDISVVYLNEDNEYLELDRKVINPNQSNTEILFNAVNKIYPKRIDNRYFVYYDKILLGEERSLIENLREIQVINFEEIETVSDYEVSYFKERTHPITTEISNRWGLVNYDSAKNPVFSAKINSTELSDSGLSYKIIEANLSGEMIQTYPQNYKAEINLKDLEPGGYTVVAMDSKSKTISQSSYLFVSEPIYVAWTIDWEGYNENPSYLNELSEIADGFNIPLTHFFNPRIYIHEGITPQQRDFMTNWVISRRDNSGDAIGLHLHMHHDMVIDAGVVPKDSPRWGNYKEVDGHDVMSTEYSHEELDRIISWGIEKFEENNLGTPKMYRAGGWFADLELLQVLEDKNFWLDSSGRKREGWWRNFTFWNLDNTTQPYLISKLNQNASDEPTMSLWEFPNNGLDTTAFEASELIHKFEDNYPGGIAGDKKIITYLSHPRFFSIDAPRIKSTLDYLEAVRYSNDLGPVVFITLEDAYLIWNE